MCYLFHTQINENSFIMIEFEDGQKEPYFVAHKDVGTITRATMLLGRMLSDIIKFPEFYPFIRGYSDRFYIENEEMKGKHRGINGYRLLDQKEKENCIKMIQTQGERLLPLIDFLT